MREGKYFRIPEGPADLERLWYAAERIPAGHRTPGQAGKYRLAGTSSWPRAEGPERELFLAEVESLRAAGLLVESSPGDPLACRFYVPAPAHDVNWSIGIYTGESPTLLGPPAGFPNPVLTRDDVTDVSAAFVADPFMIRVGGDWHMFFEVMNGQTGLGEIGSATSQNGMRWTYRQIVLAEPFHLSYPLVFEWEGDYYMVPESYQAGAIRLYRAAPFPHRWSCVGELMRGEYLADATLFHHESRWWMFTDTSSGFQNDTLRLFYADALLGPWCEHPRSPIVKGNPCLARPAGRVHADAGRLIRLTQGCQPYYGTEVRAFEITQLTTTRYQEREMAAGPILRPGGAGWNACGMHHMDAHPLADGRWVGCVDGWFCEAIRRHLKPTANSQPTPAW
jgi:hypothetical protein